MYDIKPLEEEWKKYNKKKKFPLYLGAFLGLLFTISLLLFTYFDIFSKNKTDIIISSIEHNDSLKLKNDDNITLKKDNIIVNKENIKPTDSIIEDIPILEDESNKVPNKVANKRISKKVHFDMIDASSVEAYKDVEERFFKSKDVDDSLFLAKSYYRNGKYKKSEFWALQTNKLNSTIDDSWIIFAQSKVKLGHKNEAINILTNYIKRSGSQKAQNSLFKIKSGK